MTVIGRGTFLLKDTDEQVASRLVSVTIRDTGIEVNDPPSNPQSQRLFDFVKALSAGQSLVAGQLSLVSLPASPNPAFYNVTLQQSDSDIKITISQSENFAHRGDSFFKNLDITVTASANDSTLLVDGAVTFCLFGREDISLSLQPNLTENDGLVFKSSGPTSFEIEPLGQLNVSALEVGRNADVWDDLQALYSFSEPDGNVFGSSSSEAPALNLESNEPVIRVPGGISLDSGTQTPQRSLQSTEAAKDMIAACVASNALTISAWIKPGRKLGNGDRPGRIISLSKKSAASGFEKRFGETRNFSLDQEVRQNERDNRYVVQLLRKQKGGRNRIDSLFSKPLPKITDSLDYVVFTREPGDSSESASLYINGREQTDRQNAPDLNGKLRPWSNEYPLLVGNEKTGDRPWDGEIHQAAVYSRALSEEEVFNNYVPAIKLLTATLKLSNVPAPFNVDLPVDIDLDIGQILLDQQDLSAVPFLQFDQIRLIWRHRSATFQLDSGTVSSTIWGNPVEFNASLTAEQLTLTSLEGENLALTLVDAAPFPDLGVINLSRLKLEAQRSDSSPQWQFSTAGASVTFSTIPPPLKGAFPVELFIESGRLHFSTSPLVPLNFVEGLFFDQAQLHFTRNDSARGWQVQSDMRNGRAGISLPLFEAARPLTARLEPVDDTNKSLVLQWNRLASGASAVSAEPQFGKLNVSSFSLENNPFIGGDLFWQFEILGQVALRSEAGLQASVLEFSTLNGEIFGNPTREQSPTRLEGDSQLKSLEDTIFAGDLTLKGTTFSSGGQFTLFPVWSTLQVTGAAKIDIDAAGELTGSSNVQMSLPNFNLLEPELTLGNQQLTLSGLWLGQQANFIAVQRAGQSIWEDTVNFKLPFSLSVGPLLQPGSQVKLADEIRVCQTENCRQVMDSDLAVELSSAGFSALVNSKFDWIDEANAVHTLVPESVQLSAPPPNRNVILGDVLTQVRAQANELFAPQFKPAFGYFFAEGTGQPLVYLGDFNASGSQVQTTTLPPLFAVSEANLVSIDVESFKLEEQPDRSCQLTITPGSRENLTIGLKNQYNSFILQLGAQPNLLPGAIALTKSRIAQRIPSPIGDSLHYYYGFTPAEGMIDLQSGMRLRIEYQNYQFVHPVDKTAETGFVSSGMAHYAIQFNAEGNFLSFDPFLSSIPIALEGPNQGVSGLVDLFRAGYRKPFYRLIYPDEFLVTSGRIAAERVAMLVGADDVNTLNAASNYFKKPSAASNTPPANIAEAYFRGRATVVPEIAIFVQEQPEYVPVGTTLRQLSDRYGQAALQGRLQRLVHEGVSNTPTYYFVDLGNAALALDLPLVQGDRVHF
ncbi:MAG: LamG domain-containing protein [Cyanobacteria bacterium J06621_3]